MESEKLTLNTILNCKDSLTKLFSYELPVKVSFKLRKLLAKVKDELSHFDEQRIGLYRKYGEDDGKGNTTIKPENIVIFQREFKELLEIESSLEVEQLSSDVLDKISISAMDLDNLINLGLVKGE